MTWGAGSGITWTYDASGGTDCTQTWGNNVSTFTCGTFTIAGTLALGANNLTMTGSLAATGARVTKGWFTDVESTNYPTVGGAAVFNQAVATTSTPQFARVGFGQAADGTNPIASSGFSVDPDGDVTAKSYTTTRVENTAGQMCVYHDYGTEAYGDCWEGSDQSANTGVWRLYQFPTAAPSGGQVMQFPTPTSNRSKAVWITAATVGGALGTPSFTALNMPSSDADPGTTAGQIKHDSSDTNVNSGGSLKFYDGTNVRTAIDSGTNYTIVVRTEYIPVAYMEDGAAPPAASSVLASTRKVRIRDFDGASNENLEIHWIAPDDYVGGIKFRFVGYVSKATAPANTEVVAFSLAGCSLGNSDVLGCTVGTAQTSSLTADASYVQYDRLAGAYSSAITVTDIAAGESVHFLLTRLATTTDTYAQDFGLAGIEIKYQSKIMLNSTY
jgi:hypothetical protein